MEEAEGKRRAARRWYEKDEKPGQG
jgi:hypothetical protein